MIKLSASKVARYRRCMKSYYYSYVKELQRVKKSVAPVRGTIIHDCLQEHYMGGDWTKPIADLKIEWDKLFDEERAEWGDLPKEVYRIMRGYLLAYKVADSKIKTLATEVEFSIPINSVGVNGTYTGFIDWIYEDDRGVWVCDHKTVKNLPSEQELYMDMQTLLYYDACRHDEKLKELLKGKKLAGVVFNHIRTKAPKEPQLLKSGGVSKAACDTDIATYFETVRKNGLDVNDYKDMVDKLKGNVFFRRTRIPVSETTIDILKQELKETMRSIHSVESYYDATETEAAFPRTLLKGRCAWDCEFSKLCFSELAGMNTEMLLSEDYEPRTKRGEDFDE